MLAAGAVSLVAILVTWALAGAIASTGASAEAERLVLANATNEKLDRIIEQMAVIAEQQLLSDRAKSVAFRSKDREAVRGAIKEEMAAKDWDAALVLANHMEREFGYTQEAATLRAEINSNRTEVMGQHITESTAVIDQHMKGERWTQALRESERLIQMYPNNEQVKKLPAEIETRRQNHKKQLVDSWKETVARKDVDGSIEVLKRLDPYLTPAEAEAMQETARGIFKEKLNNLKSQFSAAVHDEKWSAAVQIGDSIIHDFPNSRIALEVKDMMETLRQRAGGRGEVAKV